MNKRQAAVAGSGPRIGLVGGSESEAVTRPGHQALELAPDHAFIARIGAPALLLVMAPPGRRDGAACDVVLPRLAACNDACSMLFTSAGKDAGVADAAVWPWIGQLAPLDKRGKPLTPASFAALLAAGMPFSLELGLPRRPIAFSPLDGGRRWLGIMGEARDVVGGGDALSQLRHGFQNLIQTFVSLIGLHSRHARHPETVRALRDLSARTDALIALYAHPDSQPDDHIDLSEYLEEVMRRVVAIYDPDDLVDADIEAQGFAVSRRTAGLLAQLLTELLVDDFAHVEPHQLAHAGGLRLVLRMDGAEAELVLASEAVSPPAERGGPVFEPVRDIDGAVSLSADTLACPRAGERRAGPLGAGPLGAGPLGMTLARSLAKGLGGSLDQQINGANRLTRVRFPTECALGANGATT